MNKILSIIVACLFMGHPYCYGMEQEKAEVAFWTFIYRKYPCYLLTGTMNKDVLTRDGTIDISIKRDSAGKKIQIIPTAEEEKVFSNILNLSFRKLKLEYLPYEIGVLKSLTSLTTLFNCFTKVPTEIGNLLKLKNLYLYSNMLTTVPTEIGYLTSLQNLLLGHNQLTVIPTEIGLLTSLHTLELHDNKLTNLPTEIGTLASLNTLYFAFNPLISIPTEIGALSSLKDLSFSACGLTSFPLQIGGIKSLETLQFQDNPYYDVLINTKYISSRDYSCATGFRAYCQDFYVFLLCSHMTKEGLTFANENNEESDTLFIPTDITQTIFNYFRLISR